MLRNETGQGNLFAWNKYNWKYLKRIRERFEMDIYLDCLYGYQKKKKKNK